MATYKATSKKKDSGSNVFKATERKSYDSSYINKWEEENEEARSILDDYITRRNKNDWFAEDEVGNYRSALDKYKSSSKSLAEIRKSFGSFSDEDEKGLDSHISNLSSDLDTMFQISSTYKTKRDYEKAVADAKKSAEEYEKKKSYDLEAGQEDIARLERFLSEAKGYKSKADDAERKSKVWQGRGGVNAPAGTGNSSQYKEQLTGFLKDHGYSSIDEIENDLSNKKVYYNQAERIQEGVRLSGVADPESEFYDPEFAKNSGYVSTESDAWHSGLTSQYGMKYDDLAYEYINNVDGIRDEINDKARAYGKDTSPYAEKGYDHLTEQEVAIYNYYYARDGKEAAEKYLDNLQETLNHRKATEKFKDFEGRPVAEILFGIPAGVDQFESGVKNLFNTEDDYIPTSAVQMASQMVREDLGDDGWKLPEFLGGASLGQVAYDITTTTSNMLPSVIVGAATNPIVGTSLLGASAAGNAYQEMLNFGYDKGQARMYSTLVGASEALLTYALGGITKLGGKATGGAVTKLLSKIDNAYARAAIRLGGSMISEGFEEGLQEYLEPWFKTIAFNTDYEAANLDEILYSGLLGALSAFGLEGSNIISSELATYSQGKNLKTYGEVDRLVSLGKTFTADTVAYQIASKVNKDTGAYTIGRLFNEVGASLSEKNIADIKNALVERHIDERYAKTLVEGLENTVNGVELTKKQQVALEKNPVLADVWNDVIINPNSTIMQRSMEYGAITNKSKTSVSEIYGDPESVQALVDEGLASPDGSQSKTLATEYSKILESGKNLSNNQIQKLVDANSKQITTEEKVEKADIESKESVVNSKLIVSDDGRTINTKTEKNIKIKEIASIKDGEMILKTEDGDTVSAKDVSFSDSDALIYSAVLDMGINAASANAIIGNYDPSEGITASQYFLGVKEAYKYGKYRIPVREMSLDGFSADLSEAQRTLAYRLGASDAKHSVKETQAKIIDAIEERKQSGVEKAGAKGKFRIDAGTKNILEKLDSDQKAVVGFFRDFAAVLPSGLRVTQKLIVGTDGKKREVNGLTNPNTGEMVFSLDSDASNDPVAAVLFTAGHESGHYIKVYNPEGFRRLGIFLAQEYGKKGESVDAIVREKMNHYGYTYDVAHEEFVCQSLQRMFASVINNKDSGVLQRLQQYDNKVAQLLYKALSKLASKISSLLEKITPKTKEEAFVAEMDATMRKLFESMYAEELVTAIDNAQWLSGVDVMNNILGNKSIEVGKASVQEMNRRQTRFQEKTEYEAQPKEIITVGTDAKKPKANRKTLGGKNKVTIAGKTFGGDVSVKELRDARFKENGFSQKEIDKHNEFIQHMADMMKEARVKYRFIGLDDIYNAKILVSPTSGEIVLSALVNNGDYPINFDFTKICKKRVALQQIVDQLAREKGKKNADGSVTEVNLSPENIKAINDILADAGIETACLCCFVESKRYNIQSLIQENVIDVWNSIVDEFDSNAGYFNFADESVNESKIPDKEFDALYEQVVAWRKQKGKSSIPKDKMYQFLETTPAARKKLRFSDLVTEKGRTNLHKLYPDIEGLIGSTLGTAAPKSVEAFAPYNGEIDLMESTSETGMSKYLFSIAGARSQSFSDFMIAHIFDVVRKTASLSARKFPAHVYTKEIARARLFGMTGEKHNMSVLFNIDPEVDSWNAGLKEDGSYFLSDYKAYKSGESQYIQSIGWDDAVNLQNTEGYSKDCGIIAVGFSYNNMIKIHNDPDVRQVIGYHTSSLPAVVKPLTNLDKATDYTPVQNTLAFKGFVKPMYAIPEGVPSYATPPQDVTPVKGNAKTQKVSDTFDIKATFNKLAKGKKGEARTQAAKETLRQLLEYADSHGLVLVTQKAEGGHGDFDLYSDVEKTKNPYMSADHYIEYCIERGYLPAFYEFSMNPNYYKDIFDFNVFDRLSYNPETGLHEDSDGRQAYAPQTAVHMLNEDGSYAFPSDFFEIVDKQMKNYDEYSQMVESKMPSVMKKITAIDGMTSNLKLQAKELQRKDPTMLTERDLLSLLEFSKAKMLRDGSFIPVRINTPQILIEFAKSFGHTLENHPLAMNVYKARQALSNVENWDGRLQDKPHDLTAEEVVEIIKAMNNPSYLVFQTENDRFAEIVRFVREGEKEKAYAVIDFFDVDKNPELMNGYKGGKYNILVTIYPSENNDELKSYLHNKNHKVITGEEMKKKGLSQRGLGSQVPAHLSDSPFFDDSLSQTTKKSQERKYQERDSEGNTLSKGQQKFFKDSKVRWGERLMPVYHGTRREFTVFDATQGYDENRSGGLLWAAKDYEYAKDYSYSDEPIVMKGYLNITNILDIGDIDSYSNYENRLQEIADLVKLPPSELEAMVDYDRILIYDITSSKGFRDRIVELGYDGVVAYESGLQTFGFVDSNQFKNTTNLNPTSDPDIRYQERDQETEKKVISDLKTRAMSSRYLDTYATYTAERMDRELRTSSANGIPDYAKSYITWVDPIDFIYATTISEQNRERIKEEAGKFDIERLKNETQPIHLTVNFETGEIVGHEGRHRMTALRDQGISYVAVIVDALNDDRHHTKPIEFMHLKGQNFGGKAHGTDMYLHDMLPLSQRYADLARKYFTNDPKSGIRFQERSNEDISNRGLLANALESAAKDGEEKNLLRNYKTNIRLIEAEQKKLSEIKDKLFAKGSKIDPEERKKLQFEMKQTSSRINSYDRQLLNLESMQPIKKVLAREKEMAKKRQKQKDMQLLADYKEKSKATVRELLERNQESRKKAIEGRDKTLMRHKIKKVVNDLDQLLRKGSKERNVKLGLQPAVASALKAINMDTVAADERVAKYDALIAKAKDPDVIESLTATRDRIQNQGDAMKEKLEALRDAYTEIEDKGNEIPEYYRTETELIKKRIDSVIQKVGNTPLRNMSLEQLESVYELYSMVLATVRNANSVFIQGKLEDLQRNASATMEELSEIKKRSEERFNTSWKDSFSWNEMIPVYAFKRMGSQTLEKFFWEAIRGQNIVAQDLEEANNFASETRKKYGYKKWDFNKVYEFKLKDGRTFRATLKHLMSIYAYSKRDQALDHMSRGGFFFNDKETFRKVGGVLEIKKKNEVGYCVDSETLDAIKEALTDNQKLYVNEMQEYLTKMGDKGNEVSRAVWGIDIFKEKVYFPLKSVKDFIFQANQTAQESSLKNDGMTKETKPGASNPIVLEAFDEVWANHVNRMSQYHGLVIPIDNLNKIHNYGTWAGTDSMSVSTMLGARFGEAVNDYLNNFIKDLNGASATSGASDPFIGFVGKFKKTAVAASTSVVVQQPTAILRATAVMDLKYFIGLPKAQLLATKWNELKKYAPIATIKEIGGFDAGAGRQATEWLNSDTRKGLDKVSSKIDDITMYGAALGDQIGWCTIWEAVKREVKATTNLKEGSKEFFEKAGERFTEVIVLTQVYDSTLSRSGYMRSKNDLAKMMTAFMGEPTVSINMMFDATVQAKRHKITMRKAGRIIGATYASIIAASVAASLIYGLRDDDEDESYLEKFAEALGGKLLGDIIPLNMLPGFRDIVSIFDGWDVERTDMAVFKDIKDAFDGLDSDSKSTQRKIEDLAGAIASLFGLPLKNVLRTTREFYNAVENIADDFHPKKEGVWKAFSSGITGDEREKSNKLYDAIVSGDKAKIEVYKNGYKTEDSYKLAVRKALQENDPRIKEAAEAQISGDMRKRVAVAKEIFAEGNFSVSIVNGAINSEIAAIKKKAKESKKSN